VTFATLVVLSCFRQIMFERREHREAMEALWGEIDQLKKGIKFVGMSADSAVYAAQRAEANSIAARVLVTDSCPPPTRKA